MAEYRLIPVARIRTDGEQVRHSFHEESIEGLAHSLREVGMLHPVLVRDRGDGTYQLISGERRLRAAMRLGEEEIPALILPGELVNATQIQLIENLQREDLDPVERALGIQAFMGREGLSKAAASARLGVPRTTLTDWLDVLDLDPRYQAALVDNFMGGDSPLTLSHVSQAKALAASLGSPRFVSVLLDAVLEYRLSKAETRQIAQRIRAEGNVSIAQLVGELRGGLAAPKRGRPRAAERDGRVAPGMDQAAVSLDGVDGESEPGGLWAERVVSEEAYGRLLRRVDRFRGVMAYLLGGALRAMTPGQRERLVEYFEQIRAWVDDVLTFARHPDDPAVAQQHRRLILKKLKAARRRRRGRSGQGTPGVAPNGHGGGWGRA